MHDSVLALGLWAATLVVPVGLATGDMWRVVFADWLLAWQPLGLCLGLLSVAVGQAAVVAYHWVRFQDKQTKEMRNLMIQPQKHEEYKFWEAAASHVANPEGVFLLFSYLVLTWVMGLMRDEYYNFEGGIQWHYVAAQLLMQDGLQTGLHWLEHKVSPQVYQVSHKPHHRFISPKIFDAFNGSILDTILMIIVPLFITQLCVPANLWSYIVFGSTYPVWLVCIHSEFAHPWEPFFTKIGFGTAADHHVHHSIFIKNYGHIFSYWDRLMGTYADPKIVFAQEKA